MIRIFDYLKLLPEIETEVMEAVRRVLRSGRLILGPETEALNVSCRLHRSGSLRRGQFGHHCSSSDHVFRLGVGPGDEVITVANTCVPTVSAIALTGGRPIFVDVSERTLTMGSSVGNRGGY